MYTKRVEGVVEEGLVNRYDWRGVLLIAVEFVILTFSKHRIGWMELFIGWFIEGLPPLPRVLPCCLSVCFWLYCWFRKDYTLVTHCRSLGWLEFIVTLSFIWIFNWELISYSFPCDCILYRFVFFFVKFILLFILSDCCRWWFGICERQFFFNQLVRNDESCLSFIMLS